MGLKSTANPGPLSFEQPNHGDATPSVTPMRPTPLVGNWCDLPWGGEGEASPAQTPAGKKSLHDGVNFLVSHAPALMTNCSKAIAADPIATMLAPRTESSPDFLHQRENTMVPDEVAPHSDASSDGELLQDLYLATPAASLMPDDFETEEPVSPAPQDQPQPDSTAPVETQEDETVLAMPSRASHFVDFRRLPASQAQQFVRVQVGPNPTVPQQQPFQTYSHNVYAQRVPAAATYAAPATFQYSRHHVQMSMGHAYSASVAPIHAIPAPVVVQPAAVASAMGGLVHHGVHQRYTPVVETREKAQPAGLNVVLVSRFPPPPPPSLEHLHTMLRTGCSFESYYAIVMRWYKKVCATTPKAHPQVPMCPAAEHYLHDFEGWVREINMWWGKHFTRRSRGGNGARNGGRKDHQ